jgi:hypothetical protein
MTSAEKNRTNNKIIKEGKMFYFTINNGMDAGLFYGSMLTWGYCVFF